MPSSTATATATVAPTIGLLPIPISPIISTHNYVCLKMISAYVRIKVLKNNTPLINLL